jgi:hypothetical protein
MIDCPPDQNVSNQLIKVDGIRRYYAKIRSIASATDCNNPVSGTLPIFPDALPEFSGVLPPFSGSCGSGGCGRIAR